MIGNELREILEIAAARLDECDSFLLLNDLQEECITHKFAEYLNQELRKTQDWATKRYSVDCEYNKHELEPKRVPDTFFATGDDKGVIPDIVIHQRGHDRENLLVVEVKKSSNRNIGNREAYARWKLNEYRRTLGYIYTFYICFMTGDTYRAMRQCDPKCPCWVVFEFH
jgi:hypothetical protein